MFAKTIEVKEILEEIGNLAPFSNLPKRQETFELSIFFSDVISYAHVIKYKEGCLR